MVKFKVGDKVTWHTPKVLRYGKRKTYDANFCDKTINATVKTINYGGTDQIEIRDNRDGDTYVLQKHMIRHKNSKPTGFKSRKVKSKKSKGFMSWLSG